MANGARTASFFVIFFCFIPTISHSDSSEDQSASAPEDFTDYPEEKPAPSLRISARLLSEIIESQSFSQKELETWFSSLPTRKKKLITAFAHAGVTAQFERLEEFYYKKQGRRSKKHHASAAALILSGIATGALLSIKQGDKNLLGIILWGSLCGYLGFKLFKITSCACTLLSLFFYNKRLNACLHFSHSRS